MSQGNFEWDLSSIESKIQARPKQYAFRFCLNTAYKWGRGMHGSEYEDFEDAMREALKSVGYTVREPRSSFSSPTIDTIGNYCYLHPMEWSGNGNAEFVENLQKALDYMLEHHSAVLKSYELKQTEYLPISSVEYRDLIIENTPRILQWIDEQQFHSRRIFSSDGAGFEFAEQNRLPVILKHDFCPGCGLGSSDIDVETVNMLNKIYGVLTKSGMLKEDIDPYVKNDEEEVENELD